MPGLGTVLNVLAVLVGGTIGTLLGDRLPEGTPTSDLLPGSLIPWPSRFLRCDRDHPRLHFLDGDPQPIRFHLNHWPPT